MKCRFCGAEYIKMFVEGQTRHPSQIDAPSYQPACDCNDPCGLLVGDWRRLEDTIRDLEARRVPCGERIRIGAAAGPNVEDVVYLVEEKEVTE